MELIVERLLLALVVVVVVVAVEEILAGLALAVVA
jgi:hypothetical protein